jgi:hypothetical protein
MKSKALLIAFVMGAIVLGLFSIKKRQKPENVTYRLVWFELQIAPASYRFAIMPEQPILIGYEGENNEKGATMLIRYEHVPDVFERTVERVDELVKKSGILGLPPSKPDQAFDDTAMTTPSIHIRIAYADNRRWAGFYSIDAPPAAVASLVKDTKVLAKQILQDQSSEKIDGETAHSFLEPDKNIAQKNAPSVIIKVKILQSGKITANSQVVSLSELGKILDDLKEKDGGVWYFREDPEHEPPESLATTIQSVIDAIASRELPIQLQPEEY